VERDGDYFGPVVDRAVGCSRSAMAVGFCCRRRATSCWLAGWAAGSAAVLGEHRMKDLRHPGGCFS
jgi:hypothetical protein